MISAYVEPPLGVELTSSVSRGIDRQSSNRLCASLSSGQTHVGTVRDHHTARTVGIHGCPSISGRSSLDFHVHVSGCTNQIGASSNHDRGGIRNREGLG